MPHPGRMTTQKAKDFKGTMRSLLAELGHYKFPTVQTIPNCREYIQGNSPGGSSPYCSSHFLHGKIRQDKPLHCLDTNSIRIAYLGIGRVSSLHYHNSGRGRFYIWQVQT